MHMDDAVINRISDYLSRTNTPLLAVVGPTAAGKTGFSIELALYLQGQGHDCIIINADSRQLYKGMDIGTAKIASDEKQGVEHQLFDILDPREEATAGWYQQQAKECIDNAHASCCIPMIVGGSMLYMSTIIDDLSLAPPTNDALRTTMIAEFESGGGELMYQRLKEMDPVAAESVDPNNMPHLIRALEICMMTGETKAEVTARSSDVNVCIFGVHREREELVERINARTRQMFADGWVDEVQTLLDAGYGPDAPAMKSHGYKEIMQWIAGGKQGNEEELVETIAAKGRQYAKRQMTWWRGDERILWV